MPRFRKRMVLGLILTLGFVSNLAFTFSIQTVEASETIYIRPDGSIDPPTASISSIDNITYTFTADINDSIIVERDNVIIDGENHTLHGMKRYGAKGIALYGRSNITIINVNIEEIGNGIYLYNSTYCRILRNKTLSTFLGVSFENSSSNSLSQNDIASNSGVSLVYSFNNTIRLNNMASVSTGLSLAQSSNNSVTRNNVKTDDDGVGIYLRGSSDINVISQNNVTNNLLGIRIDGGSNNIVTRNNLTDNTAGIDVTSSNNIVSMNYVTRNHLVGISTMSSSNTISGNNITANEVYGIEVYDSSNSDISGNSITRNYCSINVVRSSDIVISGNSIEDNEYGVILYWSSGNRMLENNITASKISGILLYSASNNLVYHNSFIDNAVQIHNEDSANAWDGGYPSGGNYWSDYNGVDQRIDTLQNQLGSDGFGDTPYVIDAYNTDRYPLVNLGALPITQVSLDGILADNGWFTSNVTVALLAMEGAEVNMREYGFDNVTWITYSTPFTVSAEGINVFYYRSEDKNATLEPIRTRTIKIDKTAPTGSISINNDQVYSNSTTVNLLFTETDDISGPGQISLYSNMSWQPWEPYVTSKVWNLTGDDGTKTAYVRFKDNAGLISQVIFDSIILDRTPPFLLITFPDVNEQARASTVTVVWTGSDPTSGIDKFEIKLDDDSWTNIGTNTTHTFTGLIDGNHTIGVRATDRAGNTIQSAVNFTVNTSLFLGLGYIEVVIGVIVILAAAGTALYLIKGRKKVKPSP